MGTKQSRDSSYYYSPYSPPRSSYGGASSYPSYSYNDYNSEHDVRYKPRTSRYSRIEDDFTSLDQVTEALAQAGLESSNLIVGVDFTKSNEWTDTISFNHRNLHHLGESPNPYEQAISIIGKSLSKFDEDNLIPCFGFGDASTHDKEVFSFNAEEKPCYGFEEALFRYREIVPHLKLAGPTSFAPIIETAIGIVDSSGGQYHVLLIIADGQVTRSVDTESGNLECPRAYEYPLSIVLIGVGDGPWDMMKQFDDNITSRAFDNFQFVNFTEIMSRDIPQYRKNKCSTKPQFPINSRRRGAEKMIALPPPKRNNSANYAGNSSRYSTSDHWPGIYNLPSGPPPTNYSHNDQSSCQVCFWNVKDMAFGCGHQGDGVLSILSKPHNNKYSSLLGAVKFNKHMNTVQTTETSSVNDGLQLGLFNILCCLIICCMAETVEF